MAQVTYTNRSFSLPAWAAEELTPDRLMPGGSRLVASQFPAEDAQTITLAAGVVTAGAGRTLNLTAPLRSSIPAGTILDFGAGEFCTLTLGATKGASSIAGVTVASDLEGGESILWSGVSAQKPVESGILVGRTFTERSSGVGFGVADVATPDDELFLIAFAVVDAAINPDVTLLKHGTLIYEDKLPGWATLAASVRSAIRQRYRCVTSA